MPSSALPPVLVPVIPPWRQLFAALDDLGAALPASPSPWMDEADAITACCWRFGSYFHVLTGGEIYPPFQTDASLSRISDPEMRRINLEFSSALSAWLATRAEDPDRIVRRVRAAQSTLPMPWRSGRPARWVDGLVRTAGKQAAALQRTVNQLRSAAPERVPVLDADPRVLLRQEANWTVLTCYRNGPIEDAHAGMWSHGREVPGFLRLDAGEVGRLERHVSEQLALYLLTREALSTDAVRIAAALWGPRGWSLTAETSAIAFLGMPGAGPLDVRLRELAGRYPHHFGGAITAGRHDVVGDHVIE
jgi:hypothetical protein